MNGHIAIWPDPDAVGIEKIGRETVRSLVAEGTGVVFIGELARGPCDRREERVEYVGQPLGKPWPDPPNGGNTGELAVAAGRDERNARAAGPGLDVGFAMGTGCALAHL